VGSNLRPRQRVAAFALTQPGLGPFVHREASSAASGRGVVEHDGRSDLVRLVAPSWLPLRGLRTAEVLCADVGSAVVDRSLRRTVSALPLGRVEGVIGELVRAGVLRDVGRVRLVVRVLDERSFTRTQLRDAVARRLARPVVRDHGEAVEVWLCQTSAAVLRVGVRVPLSAAARLPRHRERPGSLRPVVAAAMVSLVGDGPGRLLDPCSGSGTVLSEAVGRGWSTVGGDLDDDALAVARANVAGASLLRLDARRLPFPSGSFDAVVTNVPFGAQHPLQGAPVAWYRKALQEARRVAPRVVVLAPDRREFRQALGRLPLGCTPVRHPVQVLGRPADVWLLA
jgi:hypothetical protein